MEPNRIALRPPTEADVAEAVARLVLALDPLRIDVFGSVAKGTARAGSDVDLLIVLDHLDRVDKRAMRVRARESIGPIGIGVDVVATSPEEIERRGHLVGGVLREALLHGRTVYTRPITTSV